MRCFIGMCVCACARYFEWEQNPCNEDVDAPSLDVAGKCTSVVAVVTFVGGGGGGRYYVRPSVQSMGVILHSRAAAQ